MDIKLIDIQGLSKILNRAPNTIKSYLKHNPEKLPNPIKLPNTTKTYWRDVDVQSWILSGNLTRYLTPLDIQNRLDNFWNNQ